MLERDQKDPDLDHETEDPHQGQGEDLGAPEVDLGADLGNREVVLAIKGDIIQGPDHTAKEVKAKKGGKMAHGPHQRKRQFAPLQRNRSE